MAPLLFHPCLLLLLVVGPMTMCESHPLEHGVPQLLATVANSPTDTAEQPANGREVADNGLRGVIHSSREGVSVEEGVSTHTDQDGTQGISNMAVNPVPRGLAVAFENLDAGEYSYSSSTGENKQTSGPTETEEEGAGVVIDIAFEDLVVRAWKLGDGHYRVQIMEPLGPQPMVITVSRPGSSLLSHTPSEGHVATETPDIAEDVKSNVARANSLAPTNSLSVSTFNHQEENAPLNNVPSTPLQRLSTSQSCDKQSGGYILHSQTLQPSQDLLVVREDCGQLIVDRIPYKKITPTESVLKVDKEETELVTFSSKGGEHIPRRDNENISTLMFDSGEVVPVMEGGDAESDEPLPCLQRYIRDVSPSGKGEDHDCEAYETGAKNDFTNDDQESHKEELEPKADTDDGFGSNDVVEIRTDNTATEAVEEDMIDAKFSGTLAPEPLPDSKSPCQSPNSTTCFHAESDEKATNDRTDELTTDSSQDEDPRRYSDDTDPTRSTPFHAIEFPHQDPTSQSHRQSRPNKPIVFPGRGKEESTILYFPKSRPRMRVANWPNKPQRPLVFPDREKEESTITYFPEDGSKTRVTDRSGSVGISTAQTSGGDALHSGADSQEERSKLNQTEFNHYYSSGAGTGRTNETLTNYDVVGRIWHEIVFPQR